jgi:phage baseplate assembly protein W
MPFNHFIPQRSEEMLKVQYQPLFPLQYDGLFGPYKPVSSLRDSIQKDFEYLLLTNPGEWPMNPDLGIGVKRYLFETFGSPEMNKIQERIRAQLQRYLPFPYIQLFSAAFESDPEEQDQGYASLVIKYAILDDLVRQIIVTQMGVNVTDIQVNNRFPAGAQSRYPTISSNMRTIR